MSARPLLLSLAVLTLAGCASLSDDGGTGPVRQLTQSRLGTTATPPRTEADRQASQARVAELLQRPLTPDSAVEIALLNNRQLQARYAALGVVEADRVRAGRLANPTFSFGQRRGDGETEIDRSLMFNVLGLLTVPLNEQAAARTLERGQLQLAADTVDAAHEARRAYIDAVAAQQLWAYAQQVQDAADAAAELAQRMLAAGHFNKLDQMREQAFAADARLQVTRAQHEVTASRERLIRVLALDAAQTTFQLPARLPDLPAHEAPAQQAEQQALDQRLDVQMAKRAAEATAADLGLTRRTRLINVLHAGYQNASTTGASLSQGYEVELALPLFDFGEARVARAEALYMQSVHQAAQVAIQAQSEVREAHSAYRAAYAQARHYQDEVVPLRQRISDEMLLRYNGMFNSVFELLADAREQVRSVTGAVQALRQFWLAESQLQTAVYGRGGSLTGLGESATTATPSAATH